MGLQYAVLQKISDALNVADIVIAAGIADRDGEPVGEVALMRSFHLDVLIAGREQRQRVNGQLRQPPRRADVHLDVVVGTENGFPRSTDDIQPADEHILVPSGSETAEDVGSVLIGDRKVYQARRAARHERCGGESRYFDIIPQYEFGGVGRTVLLTLRDADGEGAGLVGLVDHHETVPGGAVRCIPRPCEEVAVERL